MEPVFLQVFIVYNFLVHCKFSLFFSRPLQIMRSFVFFSILFVISSFSGFLIRFSYAYPSYESCSPSVCNNSLIRYPFQVLSETPCNTAPDTANVDCRCNRTTIFCGYPYTCRSSSSTCYPNRQCSVQGQYRILGGLTQSSYDTTTIQMVDNALFDDCSIPIQDPTSYMMIMSFRSRNFELSDKYTVGTILTCPEQVRYNFQPVQCLDCYPANITCFFVSDTLPLSFAAACASYTIFFPADKSYNISAEKNLRQFLQKGFEIKWNISKACLSCQASGGRCYSQYDLYEMDACICPRAVHRDNCSDGNPIKIKKKPRIPTNIILVICGLAFGIPAIAMVLIFIVYGWIKKRRRELEEEEQDIRGYMDPLDSRPASLENFLHEGMPSRYSYAQIERYTNNFAEKLGQGGFGSVFKGKMPNERLVAVKILDKSKHSRKQFMNEVATVGRIHHIHLVRLLGYCFQGSKKALVYEYMVNGSLEKYIHGDDKNTLDWKQLHAIAIGTARGILYLHEECRSRILHFDIKPHNVLLDANFCPKVADFGLAKLANREGSHTSLTGAMGTPGYTAPEVWSRNLGPVTDRSDVYSYGMLVMEMVGRRKNFDMQASRASKLYYPEWAFKQVENGEFGKLREGTITGEEDEIIAKLLSLVGLWCIQYNPSHRPAMSKVIKMLEGSIEASVPPLPFPAEISQPMIFSGESSSTM